MRIPHPWRARVRWLRCAVACRRLTTWETRQALAHLRSAYRVTHTEMRVSSSSCKASSAPVFAEGDGPRSSAQTAEQLSRSC
jgi:hypothetical protein